MMSLKAELASTLDKFPNDPIFTRLRQLSMERPGVWFHDDYGVNANYSHLISDVIHLRQVLRGQLPKSSFNRDGLLHKDATSVAFLAFSGYYFIVSFLAIAALGGICVPLATGLTPEEALYLLQKTKTTCVLADRSIFGTAREIRNCFQTRTNRKLNLITLTRAETELGASLPQLEIDQGLNLSPTSGCLVLFTSGTTGPPKGVVLPRRMFHFTADLAFQEVLYLASCPVHWVGGTGLIDSVLNGENLHMMKTESGPGSFWEILREGKVTEMSLSPTLLRRLMEYYNENIRHLPSEERNKYINGARRLDTVYSSGSMLSCSTWQFFTDLINITVRNGYGITEMGGGVIMTPTDSDVTEGYIGRPLSGVTVKLSDGDHGEILVKSPNMFIGYIDDEPATRASFDDEGFYKTGDRAHRVGDDYYFDGRISCDWIRFHEYTISILELEQRLMDLPYVSEAHVLPVRDHDVGGLVAGLVRLRKQNTRAIGSITLRAIREDLSRAGVVQYKLPALLRVLKDEEQVPSTLSGKILKKETLGKYFNVFDYLPCRYAQDGVEYWGNKLDLEASTRPFDWGGL